MSNSIQDKLLTLVPVLSEIFGGTNKLVYYPLENKLIYTGLYKYTGLIGDTVASTSEGTLNGLDLQEVRTLKSHFEGWCDDFLSVEHAFALIFLESSFSRRDRLVPGESATFTMTFRPLGGGTPSESDLRELELAIHKNFWCGDGEPAAVFDMNRIPPGINEPTPERLSLEFQIL